MFPIFWQFCSNKIPMPNWRSNPEGAKMSSPLSDPVSFSLQTSLSWKMKDPVFTVLRHQAYLLFLQCSLIRLQYVHFKKKCLVRCKVIEKQWKPCEISIYLNTPLKNKLSKLLHKLLTDATARCACSNKVEYPLEGNHLISAVNYHASCPLSASDWQDRSS